MITVAPSVKSLSGVVVGLSISGTSAMQDGRFDRGFDEAEVTRTTKYLARDLLGEGGSLVLGHDWRQGGVMWEIMRIAMEYQTTFSFDQPAMHKLRNVIPWPDTLPLDQEQRDELGSILAIKEGGLPARLEEVDAQQLLRTQPDAKTYFRARGLTEMRRTIVGVCHARVCLGGRTEGSSGRYPGVLEEAYLTVQSRIPLYVSRLLGGTTEHLIDAIEQKRMPEQFASTHDDVKAAFAKYAGLLEPSEPDARIDRDEVWNCFRDLGVSGLSSANGLSTDENAGLFSAQNVSDIRQCVLLGLRRLRKNGAI